MILLDMKNNKDVSSSLIKLVVPNEKGGTSFAELLKGIGHSAKDGKSMQDAPLILSLEGAKKGVSTAKQTEKTLNIESLLQSMDTSEMQIDEEMQEINPKLLGLLSKAEVKGLIDDAKNYLKEQIQKSDGYKKAEIKELPKTLGGLIEAAKKLGIDINKVTLEELKADLRGEISQKDIAQENKKGPDVAAKEAPKKGAAQDIKSLDVKDAASQKETVQEKKSLSAADEDLYKKETVHEKKGLDVKEAVHESKKTAANEKQPVSSNKEQAQQSFGLGEQKAEEKQMQQQKEISSMSLFKTQPAAQEQASTQQIVQAKANNLFKPEDRVQKIKADETLKLLLRDEKTAVSNPMLTADFSVETAKVIAPGLNRDAERGLEHLLNPEAHVSQKEDVEVSKTDSINISKVDSFEAKLHEAKQMIKYLSTDIRNAIEDYKPPFTRVKVQLNPAHLGEVDLTVVQRGKNLHVNISSNNAAMNTLLVNANELRTQLNNNGINNATLNFSDNSQNGQNDAEGRGHQQRHNERRAEEEYNYFENEEAHEEIISSLEIVVPRYI